MKKIKLHLKFLGACLNRSLAAPFRFERCLHGAQRFILLFELQLQLSHGVADIHHCLLGSLGGMILGSLLIPVPLLGGLIGMLAGSFTLVYWTEKRRLQRIDHAAHIATGAVLAGMAVLLLKVAATAGLILWLAGGLLIQRG